MSWPFTMIRPCWIFSRRLMPRRTSWRPNHLWTSAASTMHSTMGLDRSPTTARRSWPTSVLISLSTDVPEAEAEKPLARRDLIAARPHALADAAFDPALDDAPDRGEQQVPDGGRDRKST